jgi:hypothetical protein
VQVQNLIFWKRANGSIRFAPFCSIPVIEYLTDEAQRAGGIRLGADQQLGGASGDAAHGFNGVDDQVQDHLLQLDRSP